MFGHDDRIGTADGIPQDAAHSIVAQWANLGRDVLRTLFGFLFRETERGIEPLARLDYHLSHKNLHVMLPCDVSIDLTNRHVVQGRELALDAVELDPDNETDRSRFVSIFCERFNIKLGEEGLLP